MTAGYDPDLHGFGRFVRERRVALNLTQTQLAERLGWVQERISLIENGKYGLPSLPALVRMAEALDCPIGEIVEAVGYSGVVHHAPENVSGPAGVALQYALQQILAIEAATLKDALDAASDFLAEALGADKIDAFIYQPSSSTLVSVGSSKTAMTQREFELGLDKMPIVNGGAIVQAYQTGETYCTGRADLDPAMPIGLVAGLGVRSVLAVPLQIDAEIRGLMMANSAQPDRFGRDERQFLEAVTRWAGMVARRAELTESLTRAAAEEARRMTAEELVTTLAHDLGNALTPITGRIDMMRRRFQREGRERDVGETVEVSRSVGRLSRMTQELLDVARLDQGLFGLSRQTVDVVSICEDVAQTVRDVRPQIGIRMPTELCLQADAARLTQAIENLVTNAVHHTPDGTVILLEGGTEHRAEGDWAWVNVHDEGPGIPADRRQLLFERFNAGPGSTGPGLGLYLARSIVEAHEGELTVDSEEGKGTTFRISLPILGA